MTSTTDRKLAIPDIRRDDLQSHAEAILSLTEGYQLLTRQRGTKGSWAVFLDDLIGLGLVTEQQVNEYLQQRNV